MEIDHKQVKEIANFYAMPACQSSPIGQISAAYLELYHLLQKYEEANGPEFIVVKKRLRQIIKE